MVKNNFYALSLLFMISSALSANDCNESCMQTKTQEYIECFDEQCATQDYEACDEQCATDCSECPMRTLEEAQAFVITFKIIKNDNESWQTIANSALDLIAKTDCTTDTSSIVCRVKELIEFARLSDLHGSIGLTAFETQDAGKAITDEESNVRSLDLEQILAGNNIAISFRIEKDATPSEAWNVIVQLIQNFIAGCEECEAQEAECATFQCIENIAAIIAQVEDIKASFSVEVIN